MMLGRKCLFGAVGGAIVMYFLDPRQGRRRRVQAVDQLRARARRFRRRADREARYAAEKLEGEELVRRGAGRFHPVDDRAIVEHLKQVLAGLDVPTADLTIEVVDGNARLRGQVDFGDQIEVVVRAVGNEPGVRTVESYLHVPGEPAPNKEAALIADHHAATSEDG